MRSIAFAQEDSGIPVFDYREARMMCLFAVMSFMSTQLRVDNVWVVTAATFIGFLFNLVWLSMVFEASNRLAEGKNGQHLFEERLSCPNCSLPYFESDYRSDVEHIFCSSCKIELPLSCVGQVSRN
jgi:hypothetical protein